MIKDNSELSSNKIYIDKQKVLEEFFSVYLNGRKNKKVPKNYIDYFEARHFLTRLLNRKKVVFLDNDKLVEYIQKINRLT